MIVGEQDVSLYGVPGGPLLGQLIVRGLRDAFNRGVHVVETHDGLAHVRHGYDYGALDVWIDEERLGPTPMGFTGGMSSAGTGGHGCSSGRPPPAYRGPARIHAGTDVVAEATGIAWGRFVEETEVVVAIPTSGLLEVIELRGIESVHCGNLEPGLALVPREAVAVPE